jgi:integrase
MSKRQRYQKGCLMEKGGAFIVRYYVTEVNTETGRPQRVQRKRLLCHKDEKHFSRSCKAVKLLFNGFMDTINAQTQTNGGMKTADFWTAIYLPFIEKNKRASTVSGYKDLWRRDLEPELGKRLLSEYTAAEGTRFLTDLAGRYSKRTLAHVKNLASGIFSHAVALGHAPLNPWRDAKSLAEAQPTKGTLFYTREEAEDIISALVERVDCQLIMALGCFAGLRPSEIAGLKWEDFDTEWIHIRRSVVRGVVGPTKTKGSEAPVPLVEEVRVPLALWHEKSGRPTEGWVFPNRFNRPIDLRTLARLIIIPALKAKKLPWKGFHAGRRGCGTEIADRINPLVAAQWLRNSGVVALTHYHQRDPRVLIAAKKQLEGATAKE